MPRLAPLPMHPMEAWWDGPAAAGGARLRALLDAEAAAGRAHRSPFEMFADMEEKDGALYAALQTRLNALMRLPRVVQPAGEAPSDLAAAALVEDALARMPRLDEMLRALLDALAKGFAVVELLWDVDARGRLLPVDWLAHRQEHFLLGERGQVRLLAPPFRVAGTEAAARGTEAWLAAPWAAGKRAVDAPPRKFLALAFGRDARNPHGRGLCQRAFWPCWFKRANLRAWHAHNERHGAPTAVATYPPGTPEDERRALLEAIDSLQTDAGIVVPEAVQLRLLDSSNRGDGGAFRSLVDWCNDEISRVVLGATLTSGEGRRGGSLALGEVHDAVRHEYLEADARLLEGALSEGLARWIAEANGVAPASVPRVAIDSAPPADLEQQARIDRELVRLGVAMPLSDFYARYGRRPPRAGEQALVFDDSNVFQYHVRYGILSVNELRARLHLPPLRDGDRPARDLSGPGTAVEGASREELAPLENIERKAEEPPERERAER